MVTPIKKKLKKAFTITELVIVIAVIAILAAVLIPTLSGVVSKARQSVAMQEAQSEWTNCLSDLITDDTYSTSDTYYVVHYDDGKPDYYFTVTDGQFDTDGTEYGSEDNWESYDWEVGNIYEGKTSGTTKTTIVKIYTNAAAAVNNASVTLKASTSYYASVKIGTVTYWFNGSTDGETSPVYTISAYVSTKPSNLGTTVNATAGNGYSSYTVTFYSQAT